MRLFLAASAFVGGTVLALGSSEPVRPRLDQAAKLTVSGLVMSVDERTPIAGAFVNAVMTGTSGVARRGTVTDERGRFILDDLAPGTYRFTATKPGYLANEFGADRYGEIGTSIELQLGKQPPQLEIPLTKGAVVAGTVRTLAGGPASDVSVWLEPREGRRTVVTDARGEYRLFGITPGDYLIAAAWPRSMLLAATATQAPADIDGLLIRLRLGGTSTSAANADSANSASNEPLAIPRLFYYPGTTSRGAALKIRVGPGETHLGLDLVLAREASCPLDGTVLGPDGRPVESANVWVSTSETMSDAVGQARTRADGRFAIGGLGAGRYYITSGVDERAGTGVGGRTLFWTPVQQIAVTCGGPSNVGLYLQRALSLDGTVIVQPNGFSGQVDLSSIRLLVAQPRSRPVSTVPDVSGRFRIEGLRFGQYSLSIEGLPQDWSISSAMLAGHDIVDEGLEVPFTEGATLAVTVTNRHSLITGRLSSKGQSPVEAYSVVVIPVDKALWKYPRSRRFAVTRPTTEGTYSIRGLPAGSYWIGVLRGPAAGEWWIPDVLNEIERFGVTIAVKDGGTTVQDLLIGGR